MRDEISNGVQTETVGLNLLRLCQNAVICRPAAAHAWRCLTIQYHCWKYSQIERNHGARYDYYFDDDHRRLDGVRLFGGGHTESGERTSPAQGVTSLCGVRYRRPRLLRQRHQLRFYRAPRQSGWCHARTPAATLVCLHQTDQSQGRSPKVARRLYRLGDNRPNYRAGPSPVTARTAATSAR